MVALSLLALTTLLTSTLALPQGTAPAPARQIRGVRDPIYHLYLQASPSNSALPQLGPEAKSDTFFITGGSIQSSNTSRYLNVGTATTSYKPLSLDTARNTTAWGLEGDTIITTQGSTYGRQLNFLACRAATTGYYDLYLQMGSDVPAGKTCSNYQTIHLPCLC